MVSSSKFPKCNPIPSQINTNHHLLETEVYSFTVQEKRTRFVAVSSAGRETRIELTFEAMTLMFVC